MRLNHSHRYSHEGDMTPLKRYFSTSRHALLPAAILIVVSASLGIATSNHSNSNNAEGDKALKPIWVGPDRYKIGGDLYVCFTEEEKKAGKCRKIYVVPESQMQC